MWHRYNILWVKDVGDHHYLIWDCILIYTSVYRVNLHGIMFRYLSILLYSSSLLYMIQGETTRMSYLIYKWNLKIVCWKVSGIVNLFKRDPLLLPHFWEFKGYMVGISRTIMHVNKNNNVLDDLRIYKPLHSSVLLKVVYVFVNVCNLLIIYGSQNQVFDQCRWNVILPAAQVSPLLFDILHVLYEFSSQDNYAIHMHEQYIMQSTESSPGSGNRGPQMQKMAA